MFANKFVRTATAVAALFLVASTASAQNAGPAAPAMPADLAQNAPTLAPQSAPAMPVAAAPAPAVPPAMRNSPSASEIALINERMSVMQATLAELELQVKIATKRDEIRRLNNGPMAADDGFTPSVVEIGGVDRKLTANLLMQGGNVQAVRVGERVGGWQIKDITIDSLTMVKGKDIKRLAFGTAVAQPPSATPAVPGGVMQAPMPFVR